MVVEFHFGAMPTSTAALKTLTDMRVRPESLVLEFELEAPPREGEMIILGNCTYKVQGVIYAPSRLVMRAFVFIDE